MNWYTEHPCSTRPLIHPERIFWPALVTLLCFAPLGLVWLWSIVMPVLDWLKAGPQ